MAYPTTAAADVPLRQDTPDITPESPSGDPLPSDPLSAELRAVVNGEGVRHRGWRLWVRRGAWTLVLAAVVGGITWRITSLPSAPEQGGPGGPPPGGPGGPPAMERSGRFGNMVMPVVVARTKEASLPIELNALGTVTSLATATVRPQVSGQIVEIAFAEGQPVREGDPLAKIDPRNYQLALEQAQAQLAKDQSLLKNAETDLERYRLLVQKDSIAKQQYDNQQFLVMQYKSTIKADQSLVDKAALDLSRTTVTAPFAGRIGLRLVDLGNMVQSNDITGIAVVAQIKPISVLFTIPEDEVPAIMKRLQAGATLPVTAFDRGRTRTLAQGVLTTVDNQVDTSTGTVKLRARFDNADESLFPNQFVNVRLEVDTRQNILTIPAASVQRGAPGTFVYLLGPAETPAADAKPPEGRQTEGKPAENKPGDGKAGPPERDRRPSHIVSVRPIKLGLSTGEQVEVIEGLSRGDLVVQDGADRLRDGAKVVISNTFGGGGAAGGGTGGAGRPQRPEGATPDRSPPGDGNVERRTRGERQPPPAAAPSAPQPAQKP